MSRSPMVVIPVLAVLVSACDDPASVESTPDEGLRETSAIAQSVAVPDVSGEWEWSSRSYLRMPDWFVEGILNALPQNDVIPEGPNTQGHCVTTGVMTLVQTGATFEGVSTRTSQVCETNGGQSFQGPGIALPLDVSDGIIRGRSLSFTMDNFTVNPCPHHAVVSEVENGAAIALHGTGGCVIPGHPHSGSINVIDPPPGGTSRTQSFEAWRD
jgi:hypothetical protein